MGRRTAWAETLNMAPLAAGPPLRPTETVIPWTSTQKSWIYRVCAYNLSGPTRYRHHRQSSRSRAASRRTWEEACHSWWTMDRAVSRMCGQVWVTICSKIRRINSWRRWRKPWMTTPLRQSRTARNARPHFWEISSSSSRIRSALEQWVRSLLVPRPKWTLYFHRVVLRIGREGVLRVVYIFPTNIIWRDVRFRDYFPKVMRVF